MAAIDQVIKYSNSGTFASEPNVFRAENRAEINGRLLNWSQYFESQNASQSQAALLSAILGELGNNCFDHNIGQWADHPGCLISLDVFSDRFRIAVADRGQGIANSLRRVKPEAQDNAALLKAAFEERISGRSPERRGNGLKFIRKNFLAHGGLELLCRSSNAEYHLGSERALQNLLTPVEQNIGTLTAIDWSRQ